MNRPPLQIAFLTAQADPRSCALSPLQRDFARSLAEQTGVPCLEENFPYTRPAVAWRRRPLWRESLSVLLQYASARRANFAGKHRPPVLAMLARADQTVLLAGSCGLHLLQQLRLPDDALTRISFIAYGAVARQRPAAPGIVVLGRRDWIARGRGPAPDYRIDADHLDYLTNAEFLSLAVNFIRRRVVAAERLRHVAAF